MSLTWQVVQEDTDFVLLKYLTKKEIGLAEQGEGSIDEMVKYLEDDQLMYGLLRSDDGFSRGKVTESPNLSPIFAKRVHFLFCAPSG